MSLNPDGPGADPADANGAALVGHEGGHVGLDARMIKQMISFTSPQLAWLRRVAARQGLSVAELVRRAVDRYRERKA